MSRIKDMVRAGMSDTRKTGEALKKVVSKMSSTNALAKAEKGEKPHRGYGEYQKAMNRGRELNKRDGFTEMAKSPN